MTEYLDQTCRQARQVAALALAMILHIIILICLLYLIFTYVHNKHMGEFFFMRVWDIVAYDMEFNGRTTVIVEYFFGALLGIPLAIFSFLEWRNFSAALPVFIFFAGYVVNCFVLFLIAMNTKAPKKAGSKKKRVWFHLWRVYVVLTFLVLCPVVLPVIALVEYLFFQKH